MSNQRYQNTNDDPPNSCLFIIAGKGIAEEEYHKYFGKYGSIQDIWIVKDRRRQTNEEKVYIKFSKTSSAFLAMEMMNGKCIHGHRKPLKVLVASSKRDESVREPHKEESWVHLFVLVPKTYSEEDVRREFEKFGDIDYVTLLKDRKSGQIKGFGYVKYHRPYHAALAYELCDAVFKPRFVEPKIPRPEREYDHNGGDGGGGSDYYDFMDRGVKRGFNEIGGGRDDFGFRGQDDYGFRGQDMYGSSGGYGPPGSDAMSPYQGGRGGGLGGGMGIGGGTCPNCQGALEQIQNYPNNGCQRLHLSVGIGISQAYLTQLLSLIPGLDYCDLNETTGIAYARYCTPQAAAYAQNKLDDFEFPIGSRIQVRLIDQAGPVDMNLGYRNSYKESSVSSSPTSSPTPKDTYKKAAMILEKAGINPERILAKEQLSERVAYSNISLPQTQPLRAEDTPVTQRLFVVCQPSPVPEIILRDCFCRFGDLIDIYMISGRNYGYAKYASKESAMKAIDTLHGQTISGQRLKVLEAEPPKGPPEKYKGFRFGSQTRCR